ncbi:MAG: universal stress protein [Geminicoccaceae bacterium]
MITERCRRSPPTAHVADIAVFPQARPDLSAFRRRSRRWARPRPARADARPSWGAQSVGGEASCGRPTTCWSRPHRGVGYGQVERGSRDIGDAINAAAAERRADLLVMGGFGHSRFRDFVLGGATRSILAARLPTLISH